MADVTINGLTETTTPGASDFVGIWDVGAGQFKKVKRSNLVGATITGVGTIATGGYTLTVPATGTAALLDRANAFTTYQTITSSTTAYALAVTSTATSSSAAGVSSDSNALASAGFRNFRLAHNTTMRGYWSATAAETLLHMASFDNGAAEGCHISLGRNSNGSTPAAGFVEMADKGNTIYRVWPDDSGNLRINNADPTNANDTAGTVIGAQTSMASAKHLYSELSTIDDVFERIADGAAAVRTFVYRSGSFNRQRFEGVVTDYAPDYGMDRDEEHPAGKSLNEIQIVGDLLRAVAWLTQRVTELEQRQRDAGA